MIKKLGFLAEITNYYDLKQEMLWARDPYKSGLVP